MALRNMKAELTRRGITQGAVADSMKMSTPNLNLKINEKVPMTVDEAKFIRDRWLPGCTLDDLLQSDGDVPSERERLHARADTLRETIDVSDEDMKRIHAALDA